MGEIDEFDAAIELAWDTFAATLTAAFHELGQDRLDVTVHCGRAFDLDAGEPWVWVDLDDGDLRVSATPRDDLLARFRLRRWQRRRLVELGWPASTVDGHGVAMVGTNVPPLRVARADAADLAGLIVGLVREIWAVPLRHSSTSTMCSNRHRSSRSLTRHRASPSVGRLRSCRRPRWSRGQQSGRSSPLW